MRGVVLACAFTCVSAAADNTAVVLAAFACVSAAAVVAVRGVCAAGWGRKGSVVSEALHL